MMAFSSGLSVLKISAQREKPKEQKDKETGVKDSRDHRTTRGHSHKSTEHKASAVCIQHWEVMCKDVQNKYMNELRWESGNDRKAKMFKGRVCNFSSQI